MNLFEQLNHLNIELSSLKSKSIKTAKDLWSISDLEDSIDDILFTINEELEQENKLNKD